MLSIQERLVLSAVFFVAGLVLGRRGIRGPSKVLGKVLLYVILPYLMIYGIVYTSMTLVKSVTLVAVAYVAISAVAIPLIYLRLLGRGPGVGAAMISSVFPNVGFLPIPLMLLLYGNPMPAVLYASMYNVASAPVIPVLASIGGESKPTTSLIVKRVLTFPFTIAAIIAFTIRFTLHPAPPAPPPLPMIKDVFSETNIASFLIVGDAIARSRFGFRREVLAVMGWRLLASPAMHLGLLAAIASLNLPAVWVAGILIESFMPPATMNLVYAMMYGLDEEVVAVSIAYITPIALGLSVLIRFLIPV